MSGLNLFGLIFIIEVVVAVVAIGISSLIRGVVMIANPPRSQPAFDRWLQRMKAAKAPRFTSDQFDRETLERLARYQCRIRGTVMIGVGIGMLLGIAGSTTLFWFLGDLYPNLTDQPSTLYLLFAPLSLGVILGLGVSALLGAALSRRSSGNEVTAPEQRVRTYRARWFLWVNCLAFLLCATSAALIFSNILPGGVFTNTSTLERPPLGLLLLAPGLVGTIILLAEIVSRLIVRYPLRVAGLPPAVAMQVGESSLSQTIGQVWGLMSVMGIASLFISEAFFLTPFHVGSFHMGTLLTAALIYVGMTYLLVGTAYLFLQMTANPTPMVTAIILAAKPQENTLT